MSKAEVYYVQQNPNGLSAKELAIELGRSVVAINKIIAAHKPAQVVAPKQDEPALDNITPSVDSTIAKILDKHKKPRGVAMTEAASQSADASRKNRVGGTIADTLKNSVHKCKG